MDSLNSKSVHECVIKATEINDLKFIEAKLDDGLPECTLRAARGVAKRCGHLHLVQLYSVYLPPEPAPAPCKTEPCSVVHPKKEMVIKSSIETAMDFIRENDCPGLKRCLAHGLLDPDSYGGILYVIAISHRNWAALKMLLKTRVIDWSFEKHLKLDQMVEFLIRGRDVEFTQVSDRIDLNPLATFFDAACQSNDDNIRWVLRRWH